MKPDDGERLNPRTWRGSLGQLVLRVVNQLFGGTMESRAESGRFGYRRPEPPAAGQSAAEAVQALEQALTRFESTLGKMEERMEGPAPSQEEAQLGPHGLVDLRRSLREAVRRLEETLDHLGLEAQRLSDEASRLSLVADRLEARLNQVTSELDRGRELREREPAPALEPVVPEEPRFQPEGEAVRIALAAVPGFQGLMDVQRALSGLPAAEGASVVGYRNGEASLELVLRQPVSAREIVEGLRASTGHQLLIEEARPDALRLRLRFTDREGRG